MYGNNSFNSFFFWGGGYVITTSVYQFNHYLNVNSIICCFFNKETTFSLSCLLSRSWALGGATSPLRSRALCWWTFLVFRFCIHSVFVWQNVFRVFNCSRDMISLCLRSCDVWERAVTACWWRCCVCRRWWGWWWWWWLDLAPDLLLLILFAQTHSDHRLPSVLRGAGSVSAGSTLWPQHCVHVCVCD